MMVHLLFAVGSLVFHPSARASQPPSISAAFFNESLQEIKTLDQRELHQLFILKDPKGESIFKKRKKIQEGIWSTLDPILNKTEGTSTELLYQKYRIPKNRNPVIVAVIDGGIDITHPELKDHLWINQAEFYGKPGFDDDGDGYIDDVYGWNFLGNRSGRNVNETNLEVARIFSSLKKKSLEGILSEADSILLREVSDKVDQAITKASKGLIRYEAFLSAIHLLKENGLKEESSRGLEEVTSTRPDILAAKALAKIVYSRDLTSIEIEEGIKYFRTELNYHYNPSFDSSSIIGDHPEDLTETGYGNPDVIGPDAHHGTHVAGIIAANRDNRFGINGQARNVKIMAIRAVPDGDERDKDVANAIRFAVDHGARIINMSFGKPYSPQKTAVDEAVKYAESKGVLLIHAAGNDGKSTEAQNNNYPNRSVLSLNGERIEAQNWIEVGASGPKRGLALPAEFSNYGKTSVDVFAPGVNIVSTIPGNQYAFLNGTSMASPEVAGVAALLLEKVPNAAASEIKLAILSTTHPYSGLQCTLPGSADEGTPVQVSFSDLSKTGGTVNAFEAMRWLLAH